MRRHHTFAFMIGIIALVAFGATACGSDDDSSSSSSGGGGPTLKITSPAEGTTVTVPFTLTFTSSEGIGSTDSGKDHVHLFVDGKTDNYEVVTSTQTEVKNLSPGQHTIGVTLQHADHSSAGAKAQITVTVSGGASGTPSSGSSPSGSYSPSGD
jgi:hypothetical protein